MSRPRPAVAVVSSAFAVVAIGGLVTGIALDLVLGRPYEQGLIDVVSTAIAVTVCTALGVRILTRLPRQPVGWTLLALGTVGGMTFPAEVYAYAGLVRHRAPRPLAVVADVASSASWLLAFAGLGTLLVLFPDGRPPGPGWRRLPLAMAIAFGGAWVGATVQPGAQHDQFGQVRNPAGIDWFGGPGEILVGGFMLGSLAGLLLAAASAAARYRQASGTERQQLRWLGSVGVVVPLALAACFAGDALTGSHAAGRLALPLVTVLVPVTLGTAVLRYRLYDIEHFVSRTVSYLALSALVAVGFALTSVLAAVFAGAHSTWPTVAATLVSVGLALTGRRHVQRLVDRAFDRATSDGIAAVDTFLEQVRDGRATPDGIERVLGRALRDPHLSVALYVASRAHFVDIEGRTVFPASGADGAAMVSIVGAPDRPVAAITRRTGPPTDSHAVRTVLARARLGLELARAHAESLSHLADIEASRARLVAASYEERRRLERDLHDGAQQRLVALGVRVRRLQRSLPPQARILSPALDQVVDDVSAAVSDLRRLAAGLRPARLDDGLTAALEDLARGMPLPVDVVVSGPRPLPTIETAAYFVACEGVTNAVKHAGATRITVSAAHGDDAFRVVVADDGAGGARFTPGSGLAGLQDRVAAHGGSLTLRSDPAIGTVLEAVLPCGS